MAEIVLCGITARAVSAVALVDDSDFDHLNESKWYLHLPKNYPTCYAIRHFQGGNTHRTEFMHNVIMGTKGIDHANGNRLDNRRANLRPASAARNAWNARANVGTTSRHKGVHWGKRSQKWISQIQVEREKFHLGYFDDETAAAAAYDQAASTFFGEFARLNFPGASDAVA